MGWEGMAVEKERSGQRDSGIWAERQLLYSSNSFKIEMRYGMKTQLVSVGSGAMGHGRTGMLLSVSGRERNIDCNRTEN